MGDTARPDGPTEGYDLARLAEAVGMTPRNVRSYATKRLIDRPARQGRRAVYGDVHRAQLEWVRDRHELEGLPLKVIRAMIERGERPADVPTVDVTDAALARRRGVTAGAMELATSTYVALPPEHASAIGVLRGVHRLADSLGYVHFADVGRRDGSYLRRSTWRRAVPEEEATTLAAGLVQEPPTGSLAERLDEVLSAVAAVPEAVLLVGPLLVTRHRSNGRSTTARATLDPVAATQLLMATDVLASPRRAARLTAVGSSA